MSGQSAPAAYSFSATFDGTWTATPLMIVICCTVGGYNAIEGLILILSTFRQYKSLYFCSLVIAAIGVFLFTVALVLWYFAFVVKWASLVILYPSWIMMVTGQSVVLYSRLSIVVGEERRWVLNAVKWMIIVNALTFHPLTIVVSSCSYYAPNPQQAIIAYHYVERLQITVFGVQEVIISGIYIWRTLDILRTTLRARYRRIVYELLIINLLLVLIDIAGITLEYCNLFFFEVGFKLFSYSIKLKLEFVMLSKLTVLAGADDAGSRSRGDSMAYEPAFLTTALDRERNDSAVLAPHETVHRRDNARAAQGRTSITANVHHSDNSGINTMRTGTESKESLDDYATVMRAMSKG